MSKERINLKKREHETDSLVQRLRAAPRDQDGHIRIKLDDITTTFRQHTGGGFVSEHATVSASTSIDPDVPVVRGKISNSVARLTRAGPLYKDYDH